MKRRRSILIDVELDRRVERCARERGASYTDVVREALEKHIETGDENPAQWLLDLGDEVKEIAAREGLPDVPRFPIDSDEANEQMGRDRWRDKFGREPDW